MELLFATSSPYKFSELQSYLHTLLPDLRLRQLDIEIPELQETEAEKVLTAKIDYLTGQTKDTFIVDDVSFLTQRYRGFPGPYAKFINNTLGYEGWQRLFEEGDHTKVVALIGIRHAGSSHVFKGELEGVLSFKKGVPENPHAPLNDIIYLPAAGHFLGDAIKQPAFKNHRMLALDKLAEFIREVR